MERKKIRAVPAMMVACALLLCACTLSGNESGGNGAGGSAVQAGESAQGQTGSGGASGGAQGLTDSEGTSDGAEGSTKDGTGGGRSGDAASSGDASGQVAGNAQGISLIPLLINRETNALAIGTYTWGGRISTDGVIRYDALEARLKSINGELSGNGAEKIYVTRSDETAVSLVICETDETGRKLSVKKTYVLNPETGKELRLADVVTDENAFMQAVQKTAEAQSSQSKKAEAGEETSQSARTATSKEQTAAVNTDSWTLDYDGITVCPQGASGEQTENISCVTVFFSDNAELFQERFLQVPENHMVQMVPGRTYGKTDAAQVRVDHVESQSADVALQYHQIFTFGEAEVNTFGVAEYAACYYVSIGEHGFMLRDLPRLEHTYLLNSYVTELYDMAQAKNGQAPEEVMLRYGLADQGALDPKHMRLFDDTFYENHPLMQQYVISGYAYYAMTTDGKFQQEDAFWYLEGPERTAMRQVDTLGYRLFDTETLVSKQITRDMPLAPYRTDGKTFFEFTGNGDVFRFEIEHLDENARLNGTYTFEMLFGT